MRRHVPAMSRQFLVGSPHQVQFLHRAMISQLWCSKGVQDANSLSFLDTHFPFTFLYQVSTTEDGHVTSGNLSLKMSGPAATNEHIVVSAQVGNSPAVLCLA